jgi:hypothetical protein
MVWSQCSENFVAYQRTGRLDEMSKEETVKIEFEIAPFAVDFLKDYLKFLGNKNTVESVAQEAFWEEVCNIRDELCGLVHYEHDAFFKKYPHLSLVESREQLKRTQELEKQGNC